MRNRRESAQRPENLSSAPGNPVNPGNGDLTSGKQARDGFAVGAQHLGARLKLGIFWDIHLVRHDMNRVNRRMQLSRKAVVPSSISESCSHSLMHQSHNNSLPGMTKAPTKN
ncbi:hypothetical protein CCYS_13905 [Corynebacterium cystitidis DSM 20524]|uniref:Uncharacterized protein n=1 Tax=Corynebacterium cystitidis DSM 20524 TaxID=1121357 RepID=A0A1H9UWX4_9CORY|nr:hypothetical protein CCYS_13905 [Corynebacterium cystitidis DSM 20524]SES13975.1 hypothetical protein SAMN05661109_01974 [Corynebacterium cystitidis DSM 20524]SNV91458.1 Uncharacterised protein [Corynebacterium cystitidis]